MGMWFLGCTWTMDDSTESGSRTVRLKSQFEALISLAIRQAIHEEYENV